MRPNRNDAGGGARRRRSDGGPSPRQIEPRVADAEAQAQPAPAPRNPGTRRRPAGNRALCRTIQNRMMSVAVMMMSRPSVGGRRDERENADGEQDAADHRHTETLKCPWPGLMIALSFPLAAVERDLNRN